MAGVTKADSGMMENFKQRALVFSRTLEDLKKRESIARSNPAEYQKYREYVASGENIKRRIQQITGGVDSVVSWFTSLFDGNTARDAGQLGILPLIPIAIITASLAWMGSWIKDALAFNRRMDAIANLESRGVSPGEAAKIINKSMPGGFMETLAKEVKTPIVIGLGLFGIYLILKKQKIM